MKNILTLIIILSIVMIGKAQVPSHYSSTNLLAFYPFTGNANDVTSNAANAVVVGAQLTTDRFGNANQAYAFNGINQYMACYSSNLNNLNIFTISFWIKVDEYPTAGSYVFTKGKEQPSYGDRLSWRCYLGGNPFQYIGTDNWFPTRYATTNPYSSNNWTHVVLTNTGSAQQLYINGILSTSVAQSGTLRINTDSLYIGTRSVLGNLGPFFKGKLDEIAIWTRSLTALEIANLYTTTGRRNYYTKSTGSINQLSTWGTNTDGSGTSPLSFDSSNTIYNVVNGNTSLTGNFKVNGANSVVVFGDGSGAVTFPIASTDSLSADSVYINNSVTLTVSGTLQSTKLGAGTSSSVQYIGSNPQVLAAGTYENMIVSASTKTALGNITVKGILGMLASINCGTYELTLGVNTTTRGTLNRSTGSIIGRFSRWYTNATNSGTTGLYPIGTATKYTPIQLEFTTAPTTGGKITCEFIAGTPGNGGLPQYDFSNGIVYVDKAAVDGVVRYTSIGITGGSYTATYTANNYVGVSNYTNLRVLSRSIAGNWTLVGNAGTNTGTNTAAVIARTGLTSLSGEFGIGGDQSENPLPVKLTAFSAQLSGDASTRLKWQTAFEYNAAKFIIQRSTDKTKWINRGEVKSQRNATTTTNYTFNDEVNGLSNTVYYRLLQVDLDGVSTASKVVSVVLAKQVTTALHVYPNPVNDKLIVSGLVGSAHVYDITGKHQLEITADGEVNITHLPAGIYFLRTETEVIKLVKH